jgi:hypothetical protein
MPTATTDASQRKSYQLHEADDEQWAGVEDAHEDPAAVEVLL